MIHGEHMIYHASAVLHPESQSAKSSRRREGKLNANAKTKKKEKYENGFGFDETARK